MRLIHDAGPVLSLAHLAGVVFLPPRSDAAAVAGIMLYSLAVAVFLSAIESAKRTRLQRAFVDEPLPDRLITDGPYRWVRHPFYVGYILGAVAAPVAMAGTGPDPDRDPDGRPHACRPRSARNASGCAVRAGRGVPRATGAGPGCSCRSSAAGNKLHGLFSACTMTEPGIRIASRPVSAQFPDTLIEWALTVVGGSTLIVFAVALQNFFVQPPTLTRPQRLFQDLSVLVGLTHGLGLLVLNSASDLWAGIGIGMYSGVAGAVPERHRGGAPHADDPHVRLRAAAATPFCQTGPYRVIRHPDLPVVLAGVARRAGRHAEPGARPDRRRS